MRDGGVRPWCTWCLREKLVCAVVGTCPGAPLSTVPVLRAVVLRREVEPLRLRDRFADALAWLSRLLGGQ